MNRRKFHKTISGAIGAWVLGIQAVVGIESVAASAAPVVAPAIAPSFLPVLTGGGFFSPLLEIGEFPDGMGYTLNTVVESSTESNGSFAGSPAMTMRSYGLESQLMQSSKITSVDLSGDPLEEAKRSVHIKQFEHSVYNAWDAQDMLKYSDACQYKREIKGRLTQEYLDDIHNQMTRDGAGRDMGITTPDGRPVYILVCSMRCHRAIIKNDNSLNRLQFIRLPDTPLGNYLKSIGATTSYGGWIHVIHPMIRRWNNIDGKRVEPPYYDFNKGCAPYVNPDWINAKLEEALVFHPKVMCRLVPKGIDGLSANPNGTVFWNNQEGKYMMDENGNALCPERGVEPVLNPEYNENEGRIFCSMMAAWEPVKTQFGMSIIHETCYA